MLAGHPLTVETYDASFLAALADLLTEMTLPGDFLVTVSTGSGATIRP
jgi:3-hydroxy-3-methylglutaryl CoA synthase